MSQAEHTYIRDTNNHPVGAVAIRREEDDQIRLAVSKCHPTDVFDRSTARNRAIGRLNSADYSKSFGINSPEIGEFLSSYHLTDNQIDRAQSFIRIHSTPKASQA